jgi:hypothetical protein
MGKMIIRKYAIMNLRDIVVTLTLTGTKRSQLYVISVGHSRRSYNYEVKDLGFLQAIAYPF